MTYVNDFDPLEPGNADQVSSGAQEIRTLKAALVERLETLVTDIDADPLELKENLLLPLEALIRSGSFAVRNSGDTQTMLEVANAGVTLRNASFVGTLPALYPTYTRVALSSTANPFGSDNTEGTVLTASSVPAGTYLALGVLAFLAQRSGGLPEVMALIKNSVNATVFANTFFGSGASLNFRDTLVVTGLVTLGSTGDVLLRAKMNAGVNRVVYGTDSDNSDTSLTLLRVA